MEDFGAFYWGFNALLVGLYAMQLVWMRGILRVLRWVCLHPACSCLGCASLAISAGAQQPRTPACLPAVPPRSAACSSAAQHGSEAASNMSARVDPAKRYATTTEQAPPSPQSLPKQPNLPKTPSPVDLPAAAAAHELGAPKEGKAL